MLNSADELYDRIAQELILDFKATYGSIRGGLHQFRLSPLIKAKTFEERTAYLPHFQAVLVSDPSVFSVGIGYGNGDYFSAMFIDTDYKREIYQVPDESSFIAFYIKKTQAESDFKPGIRYIIYYDDELNEISRNTGKETDFDPRIRPWYQQATDTPHATKPYVFYDSKQVGLTAMSKTAVPGVVVAFDIMLDSLSQTIAKHQVTPNSEVVLINAEGQTFAYKDQQKVIVSSNKSSTDQVLQLANLKQLGSGVLSHISTTIEAKEQKLDFEYKGQRWIGSTHIVAKPGGVDLYTLIISPVDELLINASAIRWQQIITALIVLLAFIPIIWFAAKKISTPLQILSREAEAISHFDFDETPTHTSSIKEVVGLETAMTLMKSTINKFIKLINSLAGEQDLDVLLKSITKETMIISQSDAALIYLMDEQDDLLKADFLCDKNNDHMVTDTLPELTLQDAKALLKGNDGHRSGVLHIENKSQNLLSPLLDALGNETLSIIILPLQNRNNEIIGLLCLIYQQGDNSDNITQPGNIDFVEALSGFAAVTLESRQLFNMQEALLHAFIKLIAGAIDAKSPYTGGHCQRVPEITMMLAKAACESNDKNFKNFKLDDKQWEELNIACWLHDCGKVTTPEYVVDKATKLETIYDRIHEVRMRFEVLKRDAEIECWQLIADGGNKEDLLDNLHRQYQQLDDDFSFVAECNIGGEFMDDKKI